MDMLGLGDFNLDTLAGWWNDAVAYSLPLLPSLGAVLLAALLYFVGGWILWRVQKRFAARTETDLDDELVQTIRQAFRLTVVAWALWRILGMWVPDLGAVNEEGVGWCTTRSPATGCGCLDRGGLLPLSRFVGHLMRTFETRVISRTSETALDETLSR